MVSADPSSGPFPIATTPDFKHGKHPKYNIPTQMCLAHNMQIRSLNAIYLQAPYIPKNLVPDFLVYCQCWCEVLEHHHLVEETLFFPELEKSLNKPGIMSVNVEQHKAFHEALDVWGKKCFELKVEEYDGWEWRRLIDDFATPLMKHLHDEVESLEELIKYDPEGTVMDKLWKEVDAQVLKEANKNRTFPFGLGAVDATFEGGVHHFPNVPFFVPYLVDWVYARKYRGAWRFAPSDMYGKPRVLEFVERKQ